MNNNDSCTDLADGNKFFYNALQGFLAESIDWNVMDRHLNLLHLLSVKSNNPIFPDTTSDVSEFRLCPYIYAPFRLLDLSLSLGVGNDPPDLFVR
jgi:hypothetical protein